MSHRCARTLCTSFLLLFLIAARPIRAEEIHILRGQLAGASGAPANSLYVILEDAAGHHEIGRTEVHYDGAFELRNIPTGDYMLRVSDLHGDAVIEQPVTVHAGATELTVRLPESQTRRSAPGTVSLRQLSHPPDKKAVQAFTVATRLSSAGRYEAAAAELEKAIRISPEFAGAYTNLAVYHIRLRRFEEAAAESAHAIEIGGPDALDLCNLAFAQFQLGRVQDALGSATAALRLDSGYLQAHLIVGTILARDPASRPEAIRHLERAAEKFESARTNLEILRHSR